MEYEVTLEDVVPRQVAAVRGGASRADLSRTILKLLDKVWPVLRAQHAKTGHNVVMYFGGLEHIEAGVEVFGDFVDVGDVRHSQTPAGPAVASPHWGEYSSIAGASSPPYRVCGTEGPPPNRNRR